MLHLNFSPAVKAQNAGLSQSVSEYRHATRRITSYELIFVRKGRLAMFEEEASFTVEPGEFLLLRPDRLHGGTRTVSGDLTFYWLHFRPVGGADQTIGKQDITIPQHGPVSRPDHLTVLFRRFLDDQESGWLTPMIGSTLLELMLLEICAEAYIRRRVGRSPEALANKALALIRSNLSEGLSTAWIAEEMNCNPDYLGRIFKGATGDTLTEAIHRQRVAKARSMLLDSKLKINQISRGCGFGEPAYFRRIFKKYVGVSPRSFRKLYGKHHATKEVHGMFEQESDGVGL